MAAFAPWLYYWDDRDGPTWQGWWLAPEVGCDSFMAFANGDANSPCEASLWRTGEGQLVDLQVRPLDEGSLAVTVTSMEALEGVYQLEAGHPHSHGGRPVFKRARDLTAEEATQLSQEHAADVVTFTRGMTLEDSAASSGSGLAVQQAVLGVAASPLGVVGVPTVESVLDWVNGADGVVVQGLPLVDTPEHPSVTMSHALPSTMASEGSRQVLASPRVTVRIASTADLDREVTKVADEILSIPELHDEESPLPVGWVLASRGNSATACTARQHILRAIDGMENEVPERVAALQPVQDQVSSLRRLLDLASGPFTMCIWSHEDC